MMDVIMVGTLIVCIVSMLGFTVFCSKQVDKKKSCQKGGIENAGTWNYYCGNVWLSHLRTHKSRKILKIKHIAEMAVALK